VTLGAYIRSDSIGHVMPYSAVVNEQQIVLAAEVTPHARSADYRKGTG
jgi:hypothetical protein